MLIVSGARACSRSCPDRVVETYRQLFPKLRHPTGGLDAHRFEPIQVVRFEFVLYLQTAPTLGIMMRATLLALVDEVIEQRFCNAKNLDRRRPHRVRTRKSSQ